MPRRAPAEPIDHHYNIPKLNRVFAATGIVLTLVFIGMVVEDYSRGWKRIQRAFTRIDARKAREAALAARQTALGEERTKLRHELTLANRELAAHRRELARLDRKLKDLAPQIYLADQQFKFTKASLDALYQFAALFALPPVLGTLRQARSPGTRSAAQATAIPASAWPIGLGIGRLSWQILRSTGERGESAYPAK